MNISAVIVTYNRLELLKECINAIFHQSHPINQLIIINNNSTDGTSLYLSSFIHNSKCTIKTLDKNIGGAGGFSKGIEIAVANGADWIWMMDDDTIPHLYALEHLIDCISISNNIGFLCSKAIWIDGSPHLMNFPEIHISRKDNIQFNHYSGEHPAFLTECASFVSLLINVHAVKQVGLPIAEFFIWGDDKEYTKRIVKHNYIGLYVDNSIVTHKTKVNYNINLSTAPKETAWKFYYQIRNDNYLQRKKSNKILFFFSSLNRIRLEFHRINKRKKDKWLFKKIILKGIYDSFFFNPQINKI